LFNNYLDQLNSNYHTLIAEIQVGEAKKCCHHAICDHSVLPVAAGAAGRDQESGSIGSCI
jgi:hypothetical protein